MEPDRIVSFSYKPADKPAINNITYLKEHCRRNGVSFSFIVLRALAKEAAEMAAQDEK